MPDWMRYHVWGIEAVATDMSDAYSLAEFWKEVEEQQKGKKPRAESVRLFWNQTFAVGKKHRIDG